MLSEFLLFLFSFIILVGKYFLNNSNLRSFWSSSLANYIGYTIVRVQPSLNPWPNSLAYCGPTMGQHFFEIAFFFDIPFLKFLKIFQTSLISCKNANLAKIVHNGIGRFIIKIDKYANLRYFEFSHVLFEPYCF